jgi:hypothetical protein
MPTATLLLLTAVASMVAMLSIARYPRFALVLVVALASWGLVVSLRLILALSAGAGFVTVGQPSLALSLLLGTALATSWLGALCLAGPAFRHPPAHRGDAT